MPTGCAHQVRNLTVRRCGLPCLVPCCPATDRRSPLRQITCAQLSAGLGVPPRLKLPHWRGNTAPRASCAACLQESPCASLSSLSWLCLSSPFLFPFPSPSPLSLPPAQSNMKVAVDFLSPESLHQCTILSECCRQLSVPHRSKEDKLEVCEAGGGTRGRGEGGEGG